MHRGNDDDMKMDRLTQNPNNKHGDNMNCEHAQVCIICQI